MEWGLVVNLHSSNFDQPTSEMGQKQTWQNPADVRFYPKADIDMQLRAHALYGYLFRAADSKTVFTAAASAGFDAAISEASLRTLNAFARATGLLSREPAYEEVVALYGRS